MTTPIKPQTPETDTLGLEVIQRLRAAFLVLDKAGEQTIRETVEAVVGTLELKVQELEQQIIGWRSANTELLEKRVESSKRIHSLTEQLEMAKQELASVHQCLLNREQTLIRSGEDWVKAKTELDLAHAQIAVKDEALKSLNHNHPHKCDCVVCVALTNSPVEARK